MAPRILVADDDMTLQKLFFHSLKMEGYEVIAAHDGIEALDKAIKERPDLIILDVMMPGLNGFDVARKLRENPATLTLPIIMLTGLSDVQERITGIRSGVDEYVTKPVDLRELAARVDGLLKRNRQLRQHAISKMGKVVSLIGAKGGVGVTTIALNLAALFSKNDKSVILAELRADYGTLSVLLKTPAEHNLGNLLKLETSAITETMVAAELYNTDFGVRVLFGPQRIEEYCVPEAAKYAAILERLSRLADFVIVDVSTAPDPAHEAIVRNSAQILLLTEPEVTSVAAALPRLRQMEHWGAAAGMVGIVVVNRQGTMMLSLREIENRIGKPVIGVAPPATEVLGIAVQYGTPLATYQPEHVTIKNLGELVTRLIEKPVSLPVS
ncbi:MAG: response regulator [Anaerolineales bacterium]|nr:response regulator [Anaerolineales bacterium]